MNKILLAAALTAALAACGGFNEPTVSTDTLHCTSYTDSWGNTHTSCHVDSPSQGRPADLPPLRENGTEYTPPPEPPAKPTTTGPATPAVVARPSTR